MKNVVKRNSILILILLCLFMVSVASNAGIVNSKHDLSYVWGQYWAHEDYALNNYGEVCVYCHTPHSANTTISAPLWNRSVNVAGNYSLYNSPTMDSPPNTVSTVSLLCLSCHDGTVAVDEIINKPGPGLDTTEWYGKTPSMEHRKMKTGTFHDGETCGGCHKPSTPLGAHDATFAYLSTNLDDEHPVSMTYPTQSQDPYFKDKTAVVSNGLKLFDDKVECSTCHDVHEPGSVAAGTKPFLRISNSASQLCTTCHIK